MSGAVFAGAAEEAGALIGAGVPRDRAAVRLAGLFEWPALLEASKALTEIVHDRERLIVVAATLCDATELSARRLVEGAVLGDVERAALESLVAGVDSLRGVLAGSVAS